MTELVRTYPRREAFIEPPGFSEVVPLDETVLKVARYLKEKHPDWLIWGVSKTGLITLLKWQGRNGIKCRQFVCFPISYELVEWYDWWKQDLDDFIELSLRMYPG